MQIRIKQKPFCLGCCRALTMRVQPSKSKGEAQKRRKGKQMIDILLLAKDNFNLDSIEWIFPNIGFKLPGLLFLDKAKLVCVLPNIG
jgi:hypothetical protein